MGGWEAGRVGGGRERERVSRFEHITQEHKNSYILFIAHSVTRVCVCVCVLSLIHISEPTRQS